MYQNARAAVLTGMDSSPDFTRGRHASTGRSLATTFAALVLLIALAGCAEQSPAESIEDESSSEQGTTETDPTAPADPSDVEPPPDAEAPSPRDDETSPPDPLTPVTTIAPTAPGAIGTRPRASGVAPAPRPGSPGTPNTPPVAIPTEYGFSAPNSDTSLTGTNGQVIRALLLGCDQTKTFLTVVDPFSQVKTPYWGLLGPRLPVLFTAGVALKCGDDATTAKRLWDDVTARYGAAKLDRENKPEPPYDVDDDGIARAPGHGEPECDMFRALTETFTGRPADGVQCDEDPAFLDGDGLPSPSFSDFCRPERTGVVDWADNDCLAIVTNALADDDADVDLPSYFADFGVPGSNLLPPPDEAGDGSDAAARAASDVLAPTDPAGLVAEPVDSPEAAEAVPSTPAESAAEPPALEPATPAEESPAAEPAEPVAATTPAPDTAATTG